MKVRRQFPRTNEHWKRKGFSPIIMVDRPKIALIGASKAGKTSIAKVLFWKMPAHETLFLEPTHKVETKTVKHNSLIQFQVYDFPGSALRNVGGTLAEQFSEMCKCKAFVFVIDAQDEPYSNNLQNVRDLISRLYEHNPKAFFEVFIHKVDGDLFLSDEHRTEVQTEIHARLTEDLYAAQDVCLSFHCTSIYDHSIYEAVSKTVQKLMPSLPIIENLLDLLVTNCRIEKGYLFDVVSKIYIATDSGSMDVACYELCSDMIDVIIDISCIYGMGNAPATEEEQQQNSEQLANSSCVIQLNNGYLLYLKQIEAYLAFACLIREENFDRQYLLDYNINVFKESLTTLRKNYDPQSPIRNQLGG